MQKGCWKVSENGEGGSDASAIPWSQRWAELIHTNKNYDIRGTQGACYIDIDDDELKNLKKDHQYSQWSNLPDLLLEEIFAYLNIRERYYASLVCKSWYRGFYLPQVWKRFIIEDETLTRGKFNYYAGWQHVLDHLRTQLCLTHVGYYFKELVFRPTHSFHNLFQFMTLISWHIEQGRKPNCTAEQRGVGARIRSLRYTFPCNMAATDEPEERIFGTGGQLLAALKRLLNNLWELRRLELVDLLLDSTEATHLLDEVAESCCLTLKQLILVNVTRVHCSILHCGIFLNLQLLVLSPQSLSDDVVELLGYTKLRNLHIVQNRYTPESLRHTPTSKVWRNCAENNPKLRVHLRLESTKEAELLYQVGAPVETIIYSSPSIKLDSSNLLRAVELYKYSLQVYGHEGLPKFHQPKSFNDRIDSLVVLLIRECPFIKTLLIRENVSTATLLILAKSGVNLKWLYVRRNGILLRCDWPMNPEWTPEFYAWLKISAKSYEATELEISKIFGYRWQMLPDKEFKNISINAICDYLWFR